MRPLRQIVQPWIVDDRRPLSTKNTKNAPPASKRCILICKTKLLGEAGFYKLHKTINSNLLVGAVRNNANGGSANNSQ